MNEVDVKRIADALERMSPSPAAAPDFDAADAFVWHVDPDRLAPVPIVSRVDLSLLVGVDRSRDTLMQNTLQFAIENRGTSARRPANRWTPVEPSSQ